MKRYEVLRIPEELWTCAHLWLFPPDGISLFAAFSSPPSLFSCVSLLIHLVLSATWTVRKFILVLLFKIHFRRGPAGGRFAGALVLRMRLCILSFCVLLVPRRLFFVMFKVLLDVTFLKPNLSLQDCKYPKLIAYANLLRSTFVIKSDIVETVFVFGDLLLFCCFTCFPFVFHATRHTEETPTLRERAQILCYMYFAYLLYNIPKLWQTLILQFTSFEINFNNLWSNYVSVKTVSEGSPFL